MQTTRAGAGRLLFLDNVRWVAILCVVVFHTAVGYSGLPEFMNEANTSQVLTVLRHLTSIFIMPVLFFAAGFFALPSLRGRSHTDLVGRKVVRLGLPWLFGVLFLGPTMPYMGYYSQSFIGLHSASYWQFWKAYIASGLDRWKIDAVFTTNPLFHHQHFWFLSVLLELFVLFALAHAAWGWWCRRRAGAGRAVGIGSARLDSGNHTSGETPAAAPVAAQAPAAAGGASPAAAQGPSFARTLVVASVLMAAGQLCAYALGNPGGTYAFFFSLSLNQLLDGGGYFALGIWANSRGWFVDGRAPGRRPFLVLLALWPTLGGAAWAIWTVWRDRAPEPLLAAVGSTAYFLLVAWFLVIFLGLALRYLNRPSALNARLAANSYSVYLLQYPVIMVFRLLLLPWDVSAFIKFGIVLAATLVVCYLLSEHLVTSRPRLAVATLVAGTALLFVFGPPRSAYSHVLLDRREQLRAVLAEQEPELVLPAPVAAAEDGFSWDVPRAVACWNAGTVYAAYEAGGLRARRVDGTTAVLDDSVRLEALAPLPNGALAAIEAGSGRIVRLGADGQVAAVLVDSAAAGGRPVALAADAAGGIYFATEPAGRLPEGQGPEAQSPTAPGAAGQAPGGQVLYRAVDGQMRLVLTGATADRPAGLAVSPDATRLLVSDAHSAVVRAVRLDANGPAAGGGDSLSGGEPFAELFLADGRYGRQRRGPVPDATAALAMDPRGRLYAATRSGLQVFSAEGRLLGVVSFPVPVEWVPKRPTSCAVGGEDLATVYVACGDQVYAVRTQATASTGSR